LALSNLLRSRFWLYSRLGKLSQLIHQVDEDVLNVNIGVQLGSGIEQSFKALKMVLIREYLDDTVH
jgi:hypothetical protein